MFRRPGQRCRLAKPSCLAECHRARRYAVSNWRVLRLRSGALADTFSISMPTTCSAGSPLRLHGPHSKLPETPDEACRLAMRLSVLKHLGFYLRRSSSTLKFPQGSICAQTFRKSSICAQSSRNAVLARRAPNPRQQVDPGALTAAAGALSLVRKPSTAGATCR